MSERDPIIAITGSSGAGTTSVKRTFENVQHKKPDPEGYFKALAALRVDARDAMALEDAPAGVAAARAAGIAVVATRSV